MAQYCPINAIEMIGIVLKEFTRKVNLRHFFVPLEVVPRTMTPKMRPFDYNDNPVNDHFRSGLTENPEYVNSGQPCARTINRVDSMISDVIVTIVGVLAASVLRGFTGFGFGLAAVPLLSLALPPAQVVPLVVTLQVVIGVAGLRAASKECDWRAVGLLAPGLIIGIPIGLLILTSLPANTVRLVIGLIIALSVWLIQRGIRLPPKATPNNKRIFCQAPHFVMARLVRATFRGMCGNRWPGQAVP